MPSARDTSPAEGFRNSGPRQTHERDFVVSKPGELGEPFRMLEEVGVQPRKGQAIAARVLDEQSRRLGRVRPDDLDPDTCPPLKPLPARHERPEQQVAERAVLEQELSQRLALDSDVAQRLGHHGRQEHGLPGEQIRLPEEAARSVAIKLGAGLIEDGRLAFDDRDQRIASVTDPEEHVADLRAPLLTVLGEQSELPLREHGCPGCHAPTLLPTAPTAALARWLESYSRVSRMTISPLFDLAGVDETQARVERVR